MIFEITIRRAPTPVHKPVAWFVRGSGAAEWLAEISAWGVPLGSLTLYPVPISAADLSPAGVLVTLQPGASPAVSPKALPYGRIAERLYLPIDAVLSPPVTDAELAALLGEELEVYFWHPATGLCGFEHGEGRPVSRLIACTPPRDSDWGHASPGLSINQRLWSVDPESFPELAAIMEEARGDIGSQADDLSQVPERPDEPSIGALSRLADAAKQGASRAGLWVLNLLPATAAAPTWANRFADWLSSRVQAARRRIDLRSARSRELQRLLHLLATDPDQGLKFALPFGGASRRGHAAPGAKLPPRDVNFDLSRLAGGAPADPWDIPAVMQQELMKEYRRVAQRELHLGRYRRAAYIFAELLDDVSSAAAALAAGSHFREAAVLYRDRLKQPLQAAECLEQGGLWSEALRIYEELGEYERAGDLARRLDQEEDAVRCYRLAVDRLLARTDYLSAARLLEQKLARPDEALEQLFRGWNSLHDQRQCIGETFRLLGRLGRHETAHKQVGRFAAQSVVFVNSIGELKDVALTYPHDSVRAAAADTVRVIAASRLSEAPAAARRSLLAAVEALVPQDRLLSRDCRRFLPAVRPVAPQSAPSPRKPLRTIVAQQEYPLPAGVEWLTAKSTDQCYYAAGSRGRELVVVQGWWAEAKQPLEVSWPCPAGYSRRPVLLEPDPRDVLPLYICVPGRPWFQGQRLPQSDALGYRIAPSPEGLEVCEPPWASPETVALARASYGVAWGINRSPSALTLNAYNALNDPIGSQVIEVPPELLGQLDDIPISLEVRESTVYIGLKDRLIVLRQPGGAETIEMPSDILGLACSAPHTRRRVALTFDAGAVLFWDDHFDRHQEWFATVLSSPVAAFTLPGRLVAASSTECQVYSTNDRRIRLEAECRWPDVSPIAVLKTGLSDEFAVLFADGRLVSYRIPTG